MSLTFIWIALFFSGHALAAQLLTNGDFETGDLESWEDHSSGRALAEVVQRDSCFSQQDTRGIQIRGQHAALLRGGALDAVISDGVSYATLRSNLFIAGDGFAFIALSALLSPASKQVAAIFQVEILDAQTDSILVSQSFSPAGVELADGCPSTPISGQFSSHYFDTRGYAGQAIKIQFKQALNSRVSGPIFTLVDQLVLFKNGEQSLFYSRPYAQAGIGMTSNGIPYLDSRGSFDPDRHPTALNYSWWLNNRRYYTARPCLGDTLAGSHRAVLYVNDGQHAISDSLQFYLHAAVGELTPGSDLSCDVQISLPTRAETETAEQSQPSEKDTIQNEMAEQAQEAEPVVEEGNKTIKSSLLKSKTKPNQASTEKPAKENASVLESRKVPLDNSDSSASMVMENKFDDSIVELAPAVAMPVQMGKKTRLPTESSQANISSEERKTKAEPRQSSVPKKATARLEVQRPELTELNRKAYNLARSGIHWVPRSTVDNKLRVVTPDFFPKQIVSLIDSNGKEIETAIYAGRHEKRAHYAFSKEGASYPLNCILRVGNTDYLVQTPANSVIWSRHLPIL